VIQRERFVNKLNKLGYSYKSQGDRALLYKKPGKPAYVAVPKRDLLDEQYVRAQLRLAGCSDSEIETFIGQNRCNT
jgi:hypothetical protein